MSMNAKIALISLIVVFFCCTTYCMAEEIPLELAHKAAIHYAYEFYKAEVAGRGLTIYNTDIYYGLNGNPEVYAVALYYGEDTPPTSLDDLRHQIHVVSAQIESLQDEIMQVKSNPNLSGREKSGAISAIMQRINKLENEKFFRDCFITVITGAHDNKYPMISVYKGLPVAFVEEESTSTWLSETQEEKGFSIGRVVYLGPLDILYEASHDKSQLSMKQRSMTNPELSNDSYLIDPNRRMLLPVSDLRARINEKAVTKSLKMSSPVRSDPKRIWEKIRGMQEVRY